MRDSRAGRGSFDGAPAGAEEGAASPLVEEGAPGRKRTSGRARARRLGIGRRDIAILGAALLAGLVLFVVPMPYVVDSPGPTFDVAGQYRGTPFIEVSGTDPRTGEEVEVDALHEDGGELRMVTVSESGGPGNRLTLARLLAALVDSSSTITPYDEVYPEGTTQEAVDAAQSTMMRSSQSTAEAAALSELGWTVPARVTIRGAVEGSDAAGKVEDGDVIVSVVDASGIEHEIDTASAIFDLVTTTPAGTDLELVLDRAGTRVSETVTTMPADEGEEGSRLGVYLDVAVDLPLDVSFNLSEVGGPSAGMMFALGIIVRLTEGDLAGGASIAGTGTMSYDGRVGAIGGIAQKMAGAARDGAEYFLAPSSNCEEVLGAIPDGLSVVSVSTLEEALDAVEAIADGKSDSLPTCEAASAG